MKNKIILIFLPLFLIFLSGSQFDYESVVEKQLDTAQNSGAFENIPEEAQEILEKAGFEELSFEAISELSFFDFVKTAAESFLRQFKEPFYVIGAILAAALICAAAECFYDDFYQNKTVIKAVSSVFAASCVLIPMKEAITNAGEVIEECSNFMLSFIPVYSSAVTAMGNISAAAGFRTLMLGASAVIARLANEIAVPLICIYLALCVAGSVSDIDIGGISKTVKSFATWIITLSMTVFTGIMSLGTLVASSSDNAFAKTAKFLIGSSIPVVGGSVSDALSTVKGCLGITKNLLGTYAIIIICAIFIPSVISLVCWRISLSLSSGIGSILGNKNLSGLLSSASCVIGIMLALVAVTAVMFIISIGILLMTAGG